MLSRAGVTMLTYYCAHVSNRYDIYCELVNSEARMSDARRRQQSTTAVSAAVHDVVACIRSPQVQSVTISATFTVTGAPISQLSWMFSEGLYTAVRALPAQRCAACAHPYKRANAGP